MKRTKYRAGFLLVLLLVTALTPAFADTTPGEDMSHMHTPTPEVRSGKITDAAAARNDYYLSPTGSDLNPGTPDAPFRTLPYVLDVLRLLKNEVEGDITIHLDGGYYRLTKPLNITPSHTNKADGGKVTFRAMEGQTPIVSGGVQVDGWEKTTVNGIDGVYVAQVSGVKRVLQLYAGNKPQPRAAHSQPLRWAWAENRSGVLLEAIDLSTIVKPECMDILWPIEWKVFIMLCESVSGRKLTFAEPYWTDFMDLIDTMVESGQSPAFYPNMNFPIHLRGDISFLDTPGEWYFDEDTRLLYYYPAEGVDIAGTPIFIPAIESMVQIAGDRDRKVEGLSFEGITFCHGAWNEPAYQGLIINQAQNKTVYTRAHSTGAMQTGYVQLPANMTAEHANGLRFVGCVFENMGTTALSLKTGITNSLVEGCIFRDTAEGGIVLGSFDGHNATDAYICRDNTIANNVFRNTGADYWSAPAITVYYADGASILHNDIYDVPYSGISLGWGWYWTWDSTVSRNNTVAYNRIGKFMQRCRDGGGIYTLGQQPGSTVHDNYIFDQGGAFGGLYHDEGSAYFTTTRNVVDNILETDSHVNWIHVNGGPGGPNGGKTTYELDIFGNYHSNPNTSLWGEPTTCRVTGNVLVENGEWPERAVEIMQYSGLEEAYLHLLEE